MIGDIILWFRRVKKEMFCVHDYEWRELTEKERKLDGNQHTLSKLDGNQHTLSILVCKKCGRGGEPYC